jgi:hypothetical protein
MGRHGHLSVQVDFQPANSCAAVAISIVFSALAADAIFSGGAAGPT